MHVSHRQLRKRKIMHQSAVSSISCVSELLKWTWQQSQGQPKKLMCKHSAAKQKRASETSTGAPYPSRLSWFENFHELTPSTSLSHEQIRENSFFVVWDLAFLLCGTWFYSAIFTLFSTRSEVELFSWCPWLSLWIVFLGRGDHRSNKHNASFQLLHPLQGRTRFPLPDQQDKYE